MNSNSNNSKKVENAQVKIQLSASESLKIVKNIHHTSIDSTNTWAKQQCDQWSREGVTVITASKQTAGRGRFNRRWESPPDVNIYATFCFWVDTARSDIGQIPQLLALSAVKILKELGFSPLIKWPNDVLISGKKIGGILCETIIENDRKGVICGIGLNVNMPQDLLERIDQPATSLYAEDGRLRNPLEVLESLKCCFVQDLEVFLRDGFQTFFELYQALSFLKKGQTVKFHDNQRLIESTFEALGPDGSVQLQMPDGSSKIFYAGEFLF